jgi:hypothetical protein
LLQAGSSIVKVATARGHLDPGGHGSVVQRGDDHLDAVFADDGEVAKQVLLAWRRSGRRRSDGLVRPSIDESVEAARIGRSECETGGELLSREVQRPTNGSR